MLIEVKAKVAWIIDGKVRKRLETYIIDKEVFAEAEYAVMTTLNNVVNDSSADSFEIQGLKVSPIKEIVTQYSGDYTFIVALRDVMLQDDGSEKTIKYKVLLWADSISEAITHAREIVQQGYDMQIDSLKEVSYTYLNSEENETSTEDRVTGEA